MQIATEFHQNLREKLPISATIIAFNEAHNLPKCIEALSFCQEIVVIDSFSTDNTSTIAKSLGCKVIQQTFLGFGRQKQFAVQQTTFDWVLSIDADEIVDSSLKQSIERAFINTPQVAGFEVKRDFYFMGRKLKFGGEEGKSYLRLFNKNFASFTSDSVHEKVVSKGKIGNLNGRLQHFSYQNLEHYLSKFNRYTTEGAQLQLNKGKKITPINIVFRFPWEFFKLYVIKGLIFDGFPGFVWAFFSAAYPIAKYTKLYELQSDK